MIPNDPAMLYSFLNLKLRDNYSNLEDLCDDLDISKNEIIEKMNANGYRYDSDNNKFI